MGESRSNYYYRVTGDGMSGDRIMNGDTVLVEEDATASDNSIVLVVIFPEILTAIRRIRQEDHNYVLIPSNPCMSAEIYTVENIMVVGKVAKIIKDA